MALVLVTGASTGLGLAVATSLTAAGHEVVLHARSPDRLDDPTVLDRVHGTVHGDLARLDATAGVAEQADRFGRFDAVIHNAGTMHHDGAVAVNTVAPFVLTALMARPARIIVLSSSMHLSGSADLATRDFATGAGSYEDSKLDVTALALALARRWPEVMAHAVDPGWVPTRMGGPSASDDLDEGSRTQEWLATAAPDDIVPRSGGYWYHRATRAPHPAATDPRFQDLLVRTLEAHTGLTLPGPGGEAPR